MSQRTVLLTATVLRFLLTQPGEFTPGEIRRFANGFHCDNDVEDVSVICENLAAHGFIEAARQGDYFAYARARAQATA